MKLKEKISIFNISLFLHYIHHCVYMCHVHFFSFVFLVVHFINTRFEYCFRKITETIISCIRLYVHSVCGVRYFRWLVQVFASNFLLHITHWFFFVGSSRANVIRNTYGGGVSGQSEVNWQVYFTIFFWKNIIATCCAARYSWRDMDSGNNRKIN